jgi:hypothetical protein
MRDRMKAITSIGGVCLVVVILLLTGCRKSRGKQVIASGESDGLHDHQESMRKAMMLKNSGNR